MIILSLIIHLLVNPIQTPTLILETDLSLMESLETSNKIDYDIDDVTVVSNISEEQLRKALKFELKDLAPYYILAEKEYGINALFLASVSAQESAWGRSNIAKKYNNIYGWTSNSKSGFREFKSKKECILYVAERLKNNYLTKDGIYYNGTSISDINKRYNGNKSWEDNIKIILKNLAKRL